MRCKFIIMPPPLKPLPIGGGGDGRRVGGLFAGLFELSIKLPFELIIVTITAEVRGEKAGEF